MGSNLEGSALTRGFQHVTTPHANGQKIRFGNPRQTKGEGANRVQMREGGQGSHPAAAAIKKGELVAPISKPEERQNKGQGL